MGEIQLNIVLSNIESKSKRIHIYMYYYVFSNVIDLKKII